jgi:hypothetical protein
MVDIQQISTKINMGIDILDSLNLAGVLFGFRHSTAPPIFSIHNNWVDNVFLALSDPPIETYNPCLLCSTLAKRMKGR